MTDRIVFWTVSITAAVICGWWLAVRPGASMKGIATPVTALVLLLTTLLAMLALSGTDLPAVTSGMSYLASGR
jgi:hypothetical protein